MTKLKILLDKTNYNNKPNTKDNANITKNLNAGLTSLLITELAKYIESGCSFNLSIFNGNLHNDTWKSQQLFGLDFDGEKNKEISVEQVQDRLNNFGLNCNMIYPTFSSNENNNKFRVLICFNEIITDKKLRNNIQLALHDLFPEADKACKNPSRIFYGTNKKCIYLNEEYCARINDLVSATNLFCMSISSNPSKVFQKGRNSTVHYNSNNNDPEEIYHFNSDFLMKEEFEWEKAIERVELLKRFIRGDWLYHPQLFGLATNLYYIRGQKLFKESLDKCG